jgi:hypothetical protein
LIIEVTSSGHAFGTSVGDCEAWLFTDTATELTEGQFRRPFLGLGMARPISFAADVGGGVLVLATDGLWKRSRREWIRRIATREPLDYAAATLIDAAMADDGRPRDDTSLCIIEVAAERPRGRRLGRSRTRALSDFDGSTPPPARLSAPAGSSHIIRRSRESPNHLHSDDVGSPTLFSFLHQFDEVRPRQ